MHKARMSVGRSFIALFTQNVLMDFHLVLAGRTATNEMINGIIRHLLFNLIMRIKINRNKYFNILMIFHIWITHIHTGIHIHTDTF